MGTLGIKGHLKWIQREGQNEGDRQNLNIIEK